MPAIGAAGEEEGGGGSGDARVDKREGEVWERRGVECWEEESPRVFIMARGCIGGGGLREKDGTACEIFVAR